MTRSASYTTLTDVTSFLGQENAELSVPSAEVVAVATLIEALARVLANRLEHRVALTGVADETLLDKRLERFEIGLGYVFGDLERAASCEDGEAPEQVLLLPGEEFVGPVNRRSEGALASRDVVRAAGQERQSLLQPLEDLLRREGCDTGGR